MDPMPPKTHKGRNMGIAFGFAFIVAVVCFVSHRVGEHL